MTSEGSKPVDILIAGAGFAGLSLAIALRQALGGSLRVIVADPALERGGSDPRASAIVAAARRLFEAIGVWERIAPGAQPILDMAVTDSRLDDAMRPTFLTFDGEVEPGEPFAHMIENGPLLAALLAKAKDDGVSLAETAVADTETAADHVKVRFRDGTSCDARLLVAADGARSSIRERAGIATHGWGYGQASIVTTVRHERDHNGRAEEHFLPAGPFAILPLKRDATGHRSSIVWTEAAGEAERIVTLDDAGFHAELEKRFGLHLGEIAASGPRRAFPLGLSVARAFVAERIALVGDAAHVIHPIAGQGLNMGLKDIAALAETIVDAMRIGLDPGSPVTLDRYQRWRRFDTMAMGVATDGLNRLFSNRSDALRVVRDVGLGLVDRLPALKQLFIREAAGLVGEVPKLLKGEAL
ncbi:MAG TPA: ubiquinone biosynthesis hydroxylase [Xanthobacteraceae bacterium]|nr:ubiquinone biosynthesis hydroxylase [Xanthobacteraceae bacterium]